MSANIDTRRFLVDPASSNVSIDEHDTRETHGVAKDAGKKKLKELRGELNDLQQLLYATEQHSLLVVLQGMDCSGKDGVIKHVMSAFNPQGVQVTSFKVPSEEELAHDFLWRVHQHTPRRGMAAIFNRSHYEDVLVVRVDNLVPEAVWRKRYDHINDFEQLLAENGTTVLKFFLHISQKEQQERLQDRLDDPTEHWKFRVGDLDARAKWDNYMAAYEEALQRCSTPHAPWYIVPADRKWYRNLVVSTVLVEKLRALDLRWPPLEAEAEGLVIV
jgi:PPK2 family polyphosphate:nucleotide phosphotransferase